MKIILVGCGKIGVALIGALVAEGHDLVVIDNRREVLDELTNQYDVMCMEGNGADCEALLEAGVDKSELFIAVTGSDELNMLMCFLAKRQGAGHTIARIRNPQYNDKSLSFLRQQLDLDLPVNPELLTTSSSSPLPPRWRPSPGGALRWWSSGSRTTLPCWASG